MNSGIKEKAFLRSQALGRRDALDTQYRIEASLDIANAGKTAIEVTPDSIVSGFWPIRSEIDVRPLLFAFHDGGARLCLPAIVDKTTIVFRQLVRGSALVDMGYGTVGPGPEAAILDPTVMLVPLAAFDSRGHRIGYGGGYYDRAIARLRKSGQDPVLIGVAFDCQEIAAVPHDPHDIPMPHILTETGLRAMSCD